MGHLLLLLLGKPPLKSPGPVLQWARVRSKVWARFRARGSHRRGPVLRLLNLAPRARPWPLLLLLPLL
jgi:hypothetical protein